MKITKMKYFVIFLYILCASGCSTTRVVEVPVERIRVEREQLHHYDSIYISDSTAVRMERDTLIVERWRTRYELRMERDTVVLTDTITRVVTIEAPAQKTGIKWWQELACWAVCLGVVLFIWKSK